jgi:hypothetical protein
MRYSLLMVVGASLSLLKVVIVSSILDIPAFGSYSVALALGSFASYLVSLGGVEVSSKTFPRLWAVERRAEIYLASKALIKEAFFRSLLLVVIGGGVLLCLSKSIWALICFYSLSFAFCSVAIGIFSSSIRASQNVDAIALTSFVRSIIALAFSVFGALCWSWQGALAGEVVACILGIIYTSRIAKKISYAIYGQSIPVDSALIRGSINGGSSLLYASVAAAIPLYLDRLVVSTFIGLKQAGQYSLVMIFFTAASTLVGISAQRYGPLIISSNHSGIPKGKLLIRVGSIIGKHALVIATVGLGLSLALIYSPLYLWFSRYEIRVNSLLLAIVLSLFTLSVFLDWFLMSLDKDHDILRSSLCYLLGFCVFAFAPLLMAPSLDLFLCGMVASRLLYSAFQVFFIISA